MKFALLSLCLLVCVCKIGLAQEIQTAKVQSLVSVTVDSKTSTDAVLKLTFRATKPVPSGSSINVMVSKAGTTQTVGTILSYRVSPPIPKPPLEMDPAEAAKFERVNRAGVTMKARLRCDMLSGVKVSPMEPKNLAIEVDADSTDTVLNLSIVSPDPLANGAPLRFVLDKPGAVEKPQVTHNISYAPVKLTLTQPTLTDQQRSVLKAAGGVLKGELTGTGFDVAQFDIDDKTNAQFTNDGGDATKRQFTITARAALAGKTLTIIAKSINGIEARATIDVPK